MDKIVGRSYKCTIWDKTKGPCGDKTAEVQFRSIGKQDLLSIPGKGNGRAPNCSSNA